MPTLIRSRKCTHRGGGDAGQYPFPDCERFKSFEQQPTLTDPPYWRKRSAARSLTASRTLTLDAPQRMNPITTIMLHEISELLLLTRCRSRCPLHRADRVGPRLGAGLLTCRRRWPVRRVGSAASAAGGRSPASSTSAMRHRSCCTTSARRRSARSTVGPPDMASTSPSAVTSASPRHAKLNPGFAKRGGPPRERWHVIGPADGGVRWRGTDRVTRQPLTALEAQELGLVNRSSGPRTSSPEPRRRRWRAATPRKSAVGGAGDKSICGRRRPRR